VLSVSLTAKESHIWLGHLRVVQNRQHQSRILGLKQHLYDFRQHITFLYLMQRCLVTLAVSQKNLEREIVVFSSPNAEDVEETLINFLPEPPFF
jgi:hypothetical protein